LQLDNVERDIDFYNKYVPRWFIRNSGPFD